MQSIRVPPERLDRLQTFMAVGSPVTNRFALACRLCFSGARPAQDDTYTLKERRDHILVRSMGDVLWKRSYGRRTGKRSGIFARNCVFRCSNEHSIFTNLL
jgi:hypothetical protein